MKITLETYYDQWHSELSDFRNALCVELGADDANSILRHEDILSQFSNNKFAEEIYKFSNGKWDKTVFDSIECIKIDNKIVGISGSAVTGNAVRILMHRYSLLSARAIVNTHTWHSGGTIDRHNHYAKNLNKKSIYFTIYEHNRTLNAFSDYLKQKKTNKNKPMLGKFDFLPEPMMFNNVLQTVFYHNIDPTYEFTTGDVK